MDKKNTIFLTVIAVATLLVAVVGATFAYFTAQTGTTKDVPVNVTTSTTDTTSFATFESIDIKANQENFSDDEEDGTLVDATKGYVSFKASSAKEGSVSYCYNVSVDITNNNFDYSLPKTFGNNHNENYPELVLNIWKKANDTTETLTDEELKTTQNKYQHTINTDDSEATLVYHDTILTSTKICQADQNTSCETEKPVAGFDITKLNQTIKIPNISNLSSENYTSEKNFEHKITATGGDSAQTIYDKWYVEVMFVNYTTNDIDTTGLVGEDVIAKRADQNKNTNKEFKATLKFTSTPCAS